jgi:DNA polymerase III psi subunit
VLVASGKKSCDYGVLRADARLNSLRLANPELGDRRTRNGEGAWYMFGRKSAAGNRSFSDGKPLGFETLEQRVVLSASSALGGQSPLMLQPVAIAPASLDTTIEDWVHSLNYTQFGQLTAAEVPYLTTDQIASIPATGWLNQMTASARAALNQSQVQALSTGPVSISPLTVQQIGWLTVAQIQRIKYADFVLLSPSQIPSLTPDQIAAIPNTGTLSAWMPEARAALTLTQVRAIDTALVSISALTSQQVGWLTGYQVRHVKYTDFALLNPSQIPVLLPSQIASIPNTGSMSAWSSAARAALTESQVQAINTTLVYLTVLTPTQLAWLTPAQVQQVRYQDFYLLPVSHIPHLSETQIASIPNSGVFASWSAGARAALTKTQVRAIDTSLVYITQLSAVQIGWLTTAQVREVRFLDFYLLSPLQIPKLTAAQIASITHASYFLAWSSAARAALTESQIQAVNISLVYLTPFSAQQLAWLTPAQVQLARYQDFSLLPASQIPNLSISQIASIPNAISFGGWSVAARAALTVSQVQSMDVALLTIGLLSPVQRSWLTTAQIRQVTSAEFILLAPSQIPLLTVAQLATLSSANSLRSWAITARAALTVTQVRSLNLDGVRLFDPPSVADFNGSSIVDGQDLTAWKSNAGQSVGASAAQGDANSDGAVDGTDFLAWQRAVGYSTDLFTTQQLLWLTPTQVQQVRYQDFPKLPASQVPNLSAAQIASIPSASALALWSVDSLAALTTSQVQALNVAVVRINLLPPSQVLKLSTAQIQSLPFADFAYLDATQIPLLSTAQFAAITNGTALRFLPGNLPLAITREQILALSMEVYRQFAGGETPPSNYHAAVETPIGSDGLATNSHVVEEAAKFFSLVPVAEATHATIATGDWSNPAIWRDGIVPTAGAKVVISAGTTVRFDVVMNYAIKTLRIDGTLNFSPSRNTQLMVDTIVVDTFGKLRVGTAANPIQNQFTARIVIPDGGPIDATWDPYLLSRGLLSRGEVQMYGQTVTPYVGVAAPPLRGQTSLTLSETPINWKVGDRLVITGTNPSVPDYRAEETTILAINGNVVTVTPLITDHIAPGYGLSVHIANLNRNIQLAAENPSVISERPHVVFFHNPDVAIENISVDGFGRTDKSQRINDSVVVNGVLQPGTGLNPRARYSVHFHHTGVNPANAPATVSGSVVIGSPGWGYVNHSSNVNFVNNVAYGVYGASFSAEDGNEIGLMEGNLSISAYGSTDLVDSREDIHDFGFNGHGFWLQGPGVRLVNNISAGSSAAGFIYFTTSTKDLFDAVNLSDVSLAAGHVAVPVSSIPLAEFSGNTAYAAASGLEIWHHQMAMTDGESFIDDFTTWKTRTASILLFYTGRVTVRNAMLIGDESAFTTRGIGTNRFVHDLAVYNSRISGFEVGVDVPVLRSTVISGGYYAAVQPFFIEKGHDPNRTVDITGSISIATLTEAQLQGRTQRTVYMSGAYDFSMATPNLAGLLSGDAVRYAPFGGPSVWLYYYDQLQTVIPFPVQTTPPAVPAEYLGKTNAQLWQLYGVAFGGESIDPASVTFLPNFFGLTRPIL